jgi:hypothetical protein
MKYTFQFCCGQSTEPTQVLNIVMQQDGEDFYLALTDGVRTQRLVGVRTNSKNELVAVRWSSSEHFPGAVAYQEDSNRILDLFKE